MKVPLTKRTYKKPSDNANKPFHFSLIVLLKRQQVYQKILSFLVKFLRNLSSHPGDLSLVGSPRANPWKTGSKKIFIEWLTTYNGKSHKSPGSWNSHVPCQQQMWASPGKRTKLIKRDHKNQMFSSFSKTASKRLMADSIFNYHRHEINKMLLQIHIN